MTDVITYDPYHPVESLKSFQLATLADCGTPEGEDSPGGVFLRAVLYGVVEAVRGEDGDVSCLTDRARAEIADAATSVATHALWAEYVDVSAWHEDLSGYGATVDDMTHAAGVALYRIARRLVDALADQLAELFDDADA